MAMQPVFPIYGTPSLGLNGTKEVEKENKSSKSEIRMQTSHLHTQISVCRTPTCMSFKCN